MIEPGDKDISVYNCTFQLHVLKANILIKFPCTYVVEWQTSNGKKLATSNKTPSSSNSQIQFDEVLEASTQMLYDNSEKYFYKKQTILMINLISKSRPDQVKLVGRVTIDLSQLSNKSYNVYSQINSYKLTYCSINADLTFSARMISKSLSTTNLQNLDKSAFNDYIAFNSLLSNGYENDNKSQMNHNNQNKYGNKFFQDKKANISFPGDVNINATSSIPKTQINSNYNTNSAQIKNQHQNNHESQQKYQINNNLTNGKGFFTKNYSATNLQNIQKTKKQPQLQSLSTLIKKDTTFKSTAANQSIQNNHHMNINKFNPSISNNQWNSQKDRLKDEIQYNKNKISDLQTKISQLCRSLQETKIQSDRKDLINKEKEDLINKLRQNQKRLKKHYEQINHYEGQNRNIEIQLQEQDYTQYANNKRLNYNHPYHQINQNIPKVYSPRISQTLQNQRILQQNQYIIRQLQSSKKQLQIKLSTMKGQNQQLQNIWKQKKSHYEQRIVLLEKEKNEFLRQIQTQKKLSQKVQQLTEEKYQLKQEFNERQHAIMRLKYENEDKQKRICQLQKKLTVETLPQLQTITNQVKQLRFTNQKLANELKQLRFSSQQSKKQYQQQRQKLQLMTVQFHESKQIIIKLESQKRQASKIQTQKIKMQEKLNNYNSYMETLKKTIQSLQSQIQSCKYINKINQGLKDQISQLEKKILQKNSQIQKSNLQQQTFKVQFSKLQKEKELLLQKNHSFEGQITKIESLLQQSLNKRQKEHEFTVLKLRQQLKISQADYEQVMKQKFALQQLLQQNQKIHLVNYQKSQQQVYRINQKYEQSQKTIQDKCNIISLLTNQLQNSKAINLQVNTKLEQMFQKQNQMQETIKILQQESQKILLIIQQKEENDKQILLYKKKLSSCNEIIIQLETNLQSSNKEKQLLEYKFSQELAQLKQNYKKLQNNQNNSQRQKISYIHELQQVKNELIQKLQNCQTAIDQLSVKLDNTNQELQKKVKECQDAIRQYNCLAKLYDQLKKQFQTLISRPSIIVNQQQPTVNQDNQHFQQTTLKKQNNGPIPSNQGFNFTKIMKQNQINQIRPIVSFNQIGVQCNLLLSNQNYESLDNKVFNGQSETLLQGTTKEKNMMQRGNQIMSMQKQYPGGQLYQNHNNLAEQLSFRQVKKQKIVGNNFSQNEDLKFNSNDRQNQSPISIENMDFNVDVFANININSNQNFISLTPRRYNESNGGLSSNRSNQSIIIQGQMPLIHEEKEFKSLQKLPSQNQQLNATSNHNNNNKKNIIPQINNSPPSFTNNFDSSNNFPQLQRQRQRLRQQDPTNTLLQKLQILTKLVQIKNTVIKQLQNKQKQNQRFRLELLKQLQIYKDKENPLLKNSNQAQNHQYVHNFQNVLQQKNRQVKQLKKQIRLIRLELQTLRNLNKDKSLQNMQIKVLPDYQLNRSQSFPQMGQFDNNNHNNSQFNFLNYQNAINKTNRSYVIKRNNVNMSNLSVLLNYNYQNYNNQQQRQQNLKLTTVEKQKENRDNKNIDINNNIDNKIEKINLNILKSRQAGKILQNNLRQNLQHVQIQRQNSQKKHNNSNSMILDNSSNKNLLTNNIKNHKIINNSINISNNNNKNDQVLISQFSQYPQKYQLDQQQSQVITIQKLKEKLKYLQQNLQLVEDQKLFLQSQIQVFQEEKFYLSSDLNVKQIQIYELYKINLAMREELTMMKYQNQQYLKLIQQHQMNVNQIVNKAQNNFSKLKNMENFQNSRILDKIFINNNQNYHNESSNNYNNYRHENQDLSQQFNSMRLTSSENNKFQNSDRFSNICEKYQKTKQNNFMEKKQRELLEEQIKSKQMTLIDQNQMIYQKDIRIGELQNIIKGLEQQVKLQEVQIISYPHYHQHQYQPLNQNNFCSFHQKNNKLSIQQNIQLNQQNQSLKQQLQFMGDEIDRINEQLVKLNQKLIQKENLLNQKQKALQKCQQNQQIMHDQYMNSINNLQQKYLRYRVKLFRIKIRIYQRLVGSIIKISLSIKKNYFQIKCILNGCYKSLNSYTKSWLINKFLTLNKQSFCCRKN